jgi:AcrR family transcriptional regulator
VTAEQRARVLDAMARAVVRQGFAATTVADVVGLAGVSRRTFYEQFVDKEACFLAAYETAAGVILDDIAAAVRAAAAARADWHERLHTALDAWTTSLAAEPELARLFMVDVLVAGPKAVALRRRVMARFVAQLSGLRAAAAAEEPEIASVPDQLLRALVGGMYELVSEHIHDHGAASLRSLVPVLEDFAHAVLTRSRTAPRSAAEAPRAVA